MTLDPASFSKEDFQTMMTELENTVQRAQTLASQAKHMNTLQRVQIEQFQTTLDKSSKHLTEVERDMDQLQRGFCMRLCCPSKNHNHSSTSTKKRKSHLTPQGANGRPSSSDSESFVVQHDPIYSSDQFRALDENLQRMQHFNALIDSEIEDQLDTLNDLHTQVDVNAHKLVKTNFRGQSLL